MKKVIKEYEVFNFEELCEESQDKAINDYINYVIEITDFEELLNKKNLTEYEELLVKAFNKVNELETPWFLGSYIYDYCKKYILESVKKDMYLENGVSFVE